jgi:hypothetical protein
MLMMVGATFKKFPSVQTKQEKNKMMVKTKLLLKAFVRKAENLVSGKYLTSTTTFWI